MADKAATVMEPMIKIVPVFASAITAKQAQPTEASPAAAWEICYWRLSTSDTMSGPDSRPILLPAAIRAFSVAPNWNHFTAIKSRKLVPAVSRMPAAIARRRS